ncbi:MAG TPA: DNA-binding response regulator [Firmicutes bacterium]|jgi:DNA-binding response OmpR family regulator|nr:DNA-binding response regulator [Bacillota bacterium]
MKVLLAEDDRRLGKIIKHMLEKSGNQADWVMRGDEVADYLEASCYDVLILDWMMPGESGLDVCIHLRKKNYQGAIIMLTAKDLVEDKVRGLNSGADDYLIKPFEFEELYARLQALARRSNFPIQPDIMEIGDLRINCADKTVSMAGNIIQLTGREFQILHLLAQNIGSVVPREVIINRVWGIDDEITPNNLDAYIRLLRRKMDRPFAAPLIQNIRGIGYKLEGKNVC